jgi:hypothetical protein
MIKLWIIVDWWFYHGTPPIKLTATIFMDNSGWVVLSWYSTNKTDVLSGILLRVALNHHSHMSSKYVMNTMGIRTIIECIVSSICTLQ